LHRLRNAKTAKTAQISGQLFNFSVAFTEVKI
jgi:hypothetical protein